MSTEKGNTNVIVSISKLLLQPEPIFLSELVFGL